MYADFHMELINGVEFIDETRTTMANYLGKIICVTTVKVSNSSNLLLALTRSKINDHDARLAWALPPI